MLNLNKKIIRMITIRKVTYNSYPVEKSDSIAGAISLTAVTIQCSIKRRL